MRPEKRKPVSSDAAVQAADPGEHMVTADAAGLILRVHRRENSVVTRTWIVRVSVDGRRRKLGLGRYPAVGLAKARQLAQDAHRAAAEGDEPGPTRQTPSAGFCGRAQARPPPGDRRLARQGCPAEQERQIRPDPRACAPQAFRSAACARRRINHRRRRCRGPATACSRNRGQIARGCSRCLQLRHSDA